LGCDILGIYENMRKIKDLLLMGWNKLLDLAMGAIVSLWLSIAQFILFGLVFVAGLLVLDSLARNEPSLNELWHLINIISAMIGLVISIFTMNPDMILLSGQALIGHIIVGFLDSLLTPFWLIFAYFNKMFIFILDDSAFAHDGNVINYGVPAECTPEGYPNYTIGQIKLLVSIFSTTVGMFDQILALLDRQLKLSVCLANPLGGHICGNVKTDNIKNLIPGGTDLYNSIKGLKTTITDVRDTPLVPKQFFETISNAIDTGLSWIAGNYSGTDIIKHYLFIKRIEFVNGKPVSGGSKPFDGFLDNKIAKIWGCA